MFVGAKVRHYKTLRVGTVRILNTVTNKTKVQCEDGEYMKTQSCNNFMLIKSLSQPQDHKKPAVSFSNEPQLINDTPKTPKEPERQPPTNEQLIQSRREYETIIPSDITFREIEDRHKYPTRDLSTIPQSEFDKLQHLRDTIPETSKEYWPHLFSALPSVWGIPPSSEKRKRSEESIKPRKLTKEEIQSAAALTAMKQEYYAVSMIGGSAVCYR
jgi:hypothetical protein